MSGWEWFFIVVMWLYTLLEIQGWFRTVVDNQKVIVLALDSKKGLKV